MAQTPAPDVAETYHAIIDGETTPVESGETLPTVNPATEAPFAEIAAADEADIDRAVANAGEAFEDWWHRPPEERGRVLSALAELLREEQERLARLETMDNGKPVSQAESDVEGCARYFEYYAGLADKVHGESVPLGPEYVDYTVREPLGVTGHIVPWNFPINLFARSVAPALAVGNTAVVKPAEQTSVTAIEVGKLALEAGVPPGVLNIVPGYGTEAGAALAGHAGIDGLSFTGSVATGREVARLAVDNVNPVHLELGGKSPNVVFPDADFENAVESTILGIFAATTGQICAAGSRLLVHEDIHEEFVDAVAAGAQSLSIGPGLEDHDVGPIVSEEQYEKVTEYFEIGREEAGEPVIGGEALDRDGYFVEPTIFDDVEHGCRIEQEEIFGPVLSVTTFGDEEEAIELANDVDYGLVAGIFTSDIGRAHRFARDVRAGQIYINEWFANGTGSPFGGYKQSGFGREKGLEAIRGYTQIKNVCARID